MNIIYINHYAGSLQHGMEFRPYYMAREWVSKGHDVTIIAADFSHLRKTNPQIEEDFTEEIIDGVRYVWVKTPSYPENGVKRFINIFVFVSKLYRAAKKIAAKYKPDAVIASSTYPLDIYPVARIAKKAKVPFFYEIHDLWPLTPIEIGGYSRMHPFIIMLQMAENYAFKHSEKVISILPDVDRYMKERKADVSKFLHIPNGLVFSENDYKESEEPQLAVLDKLKSEGRFIVSYTGNHSDANSLEFLIEASSKLKDTNLTTVLVGGGNEKENLIKYASEIGADNVLFLNPVRKESIGSLLQRVDVAYMGLKNESLFRYGISPNKLFDYMHFRRPILYAVDASNNPVMDSDSGISIPPCDADRIAEAIRQFMAMTEDERRQLGENGYNHAVQNYDYRVLADKFVNALKRSEK